MSGVKVIDGIIITLRDILMLAKTRGIETMGERKQEDFQRKSPHFVPQIKLSYFPPHNFSEKNQNRFVTHKVLKD